MQYISFFLLISVFFNNIILSSDRKDLKSVQGSRKNSSDTSFYCYNESSFSNGSNDSEAFRGQSKKLPLINNVQLTQRASEPFQKLPSIDNVQLPQGAQSLPNNLFNALSNELFFVQEPLNLKKTQVFYSIKEDNNDLNINFAQQQFFTFYNLLIGAKKIIKKEESDVVALYCIKLFYSALLRRNFKPIRSTIKNTYKICFINGYKLSLDNKKICYMDNTITLQEYIKEQTEGDTLEKKKLLYNFIINCMEGFFRKCYYEKMLVKDFINSLSNEKEKELYTVISDIFKFQAKDLSLIDQYIIKNGFTPIENKKNKQISSYVQKNKNSNLLTKRLSGEVDFRNSTDGSWSYQCEGVSSDDDLERRCKYSAEYLQPKDLQSQVENKQHNNDNNKCINQNNNPINTNSAYNLNKPQQNNDSNAFLTQLQLMSLLMQYTNNHLQEIDSQIKEGQNINKKNYTDLLNIIKNDNQQNNQIVYVNLMNNVFHTFDILLLKNNTNPNNVTLVMDKFLQVILNMQNNYNSQNARLLPVPQPQNNFFHQPIMTQPQINNQNLPQFGSSKTPNNNVSHIKQKPNLHNEINKIRDINPQNFHAQNNML